MLHFFGMRGKMRGELFDFFSFLCAIMLTLTHYIYRADR